MFKSSNGNKRPVCLGTFTDFWNRKEFKYKANIAAIYKYLWLELTLIDNTLFTVRRMYHLKVFGSFSWMLLSYSKIWSINFHG